jgi:hypothetical protein
MSLGGAPKVYNDPSLDIGGIDKVVFEFFGHKRGYPSTASETAQLA